MSNPTADLDLDIVELMDPDWRDHFREVSDAAEFYRRYSPREWADAWTEVVGERPLSPESAVTAESGA